MSLSAWPTKLGPVAGLQGGDKGENCDRDDKIHVMSVVSRSESVKSAAGKKDCFYVKF